MRLIKKMTDDLVFEAEAFENARNWGHKAYAYYKGKLVAESKVIYYNRTWEAYPFQSVLRSLVYKLDETKEVPLADRIHAYRCLQ